LPIVRQWKFGRAGTNEEGTDEEGTDEEGTDEEGTNGMKSEGWKGWIMGWRKQVEEQAADSKGEEIRGLSLYQSDYCPFCIRVRDVVSRLDIEIELRDVSESSYAMELVSATGRRTVPVLRIDGEEGSVDWLPESLDIIRYLEERFAE
jgi:glutaredoxin